MNPNNNFILQLAEAIYINLKDDGNYSKIIRQIEFYRDENMTREIADTIILKEIPWPISVEIRRLFSSECFTRNNDRLKQLKVTGEKAVQLFAYILLAQLWNECATKNVVLSPDFQAQIKNLNVPSLGFHAGVIRSVHEVFKINGIEPFTGHTSRSSFDLKRFLKTIDEFTTQRNRESHHLQEVTCDEMEELVCTILCDMAFLARFSLISMAKIEVQKSRLDPVQFRHVFRMLKSSHSDFPINSRMSNTYSDSHCVMLVNEYHASDSSLNLSPFIIDTDPIINAIVDINISSMVREAQIKKGIYVYNSNKRKLFYTYTDNMETVDMGNLPVYEQLVSEFNEMQKSFS